MVGFCEQFDEPSGFKEDGKLSELLYASEEEFGFIGFCVGLYIYIWVNM